ncbi:MAG: 2-phospho-L-lactate guanylyltransferase [Acidobacteriales bacterium]|nr:2-phospho-L-lactate guanylyltransferase [Terriglobales bacterium]
MILIPVKDLSRAKQRLGDMLDQQTRTSLAHAMLQDVCDAILAWREHPPVALVTSDSFAIAHAEKLGFEIIRDERNISETDAIEMATQLCVARGVDTSLVIPGDAPLLQPSELKQIFAAAPARGSVLVPAADGRGSNGVLRRPANLFPLRFGNDSFHPHLAAAQATGNPCVVLPLPGLALDIDSPQDLQQLADASGNTRAQALARKLLAGSRAKIPA